MNVTLIKSERKLLFFTFLCWFVFSLNTGNGTLHVNMHETGLCRTLHFVCVCVCVCNIDRTTCLSSSLTLHTAAISTARPLLGSPLKDQAALYLFQKHLLSVSNSYQLFTDDRTKHSRYCHKHLCHSLLLLSTVLCIFKIYM